MEPKVGDTRIRCGHVEVYTAPARRGAGPWEIADDAPSWKRGELVDDARRVDLYSESFAYRDVSLTLAPNERVVCVEGLSMGNRLVWIEQVLS